MYSHPLMVFANNLWNYAFYFFFFKKVFIIVDSGHEKDMLKINRASV